MKKLCAFLMIAVLAVTLIACDGNSDQPKNEGKTIYLNYAGTASDKSFNEGLFEDFKAARKAAGDKNTYVIEYLENEGVEITRDSEEVPSEEEGREEINIDYGKYLLVDYSLNNNYSENVRIDKEYYGIDYDDTTINEGIFDLTVWQVQEHPVYRDDRYFNAPKAIAIARLHSILPTFESIGKYDIDILEPISDADFFGRGKNTHRINRESMQQPAHSCDWNRWWSRRRSSFSGA